MTNFNVQHEQTIMLTITINSNTVSASFFKWINEGIAMLRAKSIDEH